MQVCGTVPAGLGLGNFTVLDLFKPQLKEEDTVNLFSALTNLQALYYV